MIRLKLTKREWVSQSVRESVTDKHCQWSDSGPIKRNHFCQSQFFGQTVEVSFGQTFKAFLWPNWSFTRRYLACSRRHHWQEAVWQRLGCRPALPETKYNDRKKREHNCWEEIGRCHNSVITAEHLHKIMGTACGKNCVCPIHVSWTHRDIPRHNIVAAAWEQTGMVACPSYMWHTLMPAQNYAGMAGTSASLGGTPDYHPSILAYVLVCL